MRGARRRRRSRCARSSTASASVWQPRRSSSIAGRASCVRLHAGHDTAREEIAAAEAELERRTAELRAAREQLDGLRDERDRERERLARRAGRARSPGERAGPPARRPRHGPREHAAAQAELERRDGRAGGARGPARGARDRASPALQDELERRIADHAAEVDELRREQARRRTTGRAAAGRARAPDATTPPTSRELERVRSGQAAGQAEVERPRALPRRCDAELERVQGRARDGTRRAEAARRRARRRRAGTSSGGPADHIALQAELAREQAAHVASQSELGREQELRPPPRPSCRSASSSSRSCELEALRAARRDAGQDISELDRAAARLREQTPPARSRRSEEPAAEPEPAPRERRSTVTSSRGCWPPSRRPRLPQPRRIAHAHLPEFAGQRGRPVRDRGGRVAA